MIITKIEQDLSAVLGHLNLIKHEAKDISALYFATDASTLVGALQSESSPATVSTKLTKGALISGITLSQQMDAFFTNQATSQGNYLQNAYGLMHGSAVLNTALSNDVEALGERMKAMATSIVEREKEIRDILKNYNDSELTLAVAALSSGTMVFGTNKTKTLYTAAIYLVESFRALLTNVSNPQGDFESTIAKWVSVY